MNAEIITVGTEILLGGIVDTNSQFIAKQLFPLGINVYYLQSVGDNPARLKEALHIAEERSDIVFVSGGLGPTSDDITKETLSEHLSLPLHYDDLSKKHVHAFFEQIGENATTNNYKQAQILAGSDALENPSGLACGIWLDYNDTIYVLLPGPPHELKSTFNHAVLPKLTSHIGEQFFERNYRFLGIGEAKVDAILASHSISSNPTVAPYANSGEVEVRICAKAKNLEEAEAMMLPVDVAIHEHLSEYLYTSEFPNLQSTLADFLNSNKLTISTAESCTGGLLSKQLTDLPGSSSYFLGGVCSYSNEAKMYILGVNPDTLTEYGSVSPETALEMARSCRTLFQTDISLSTTGLAGPEGGTPEKPVGLVYIGLSTANVEKTFTLNLYDGYPHSRSFIRHQACRYAFFYALKYLK